MRHRYVYHVVTTRTREKAAVTAAMHHLHLHTGGFLGGDDPEPTMLWDVEVTDGPPVDMLTSDDGAVPMVLDKDLMDPAEW